MTYSSRYIVPLLFCLGATALACSSSDDIPEGTTNGDGDGAGNSPGTGNAPGDGDGSGSGGLSGDGDGDGSGGVSGDGDGDGSGGVSGDGDGDGSGGVSGDGDGDAPVMGDPAGESCALGTNYSLGEMRILNNQWTSHQSDQCIFINEDRSFGWKWDNGGGDWTPLATSQADYPNYPEVEFGINPWGRQQDEWEIGSSSTTLLPIRKGDITEASMTIDVNSMTNNGGSWNLAFEMWLSPTDPTQGQTSPSAEIMVFFGNDAAYWPESPEPGAGATLGDYTLYHTSEDWADGYAYRQWRKNGTVGGSTSFNGTLDIKQFLDQSGFDDNWYVTRFEIGNEVYVGSQGETTIKSLSFSVNGQSRSAL